MKALRELDQWWDKHIGAEPESRKLRTAVYAGKWLLLRAVVRWKVPAASIRDLQIQVTNDAEWGTRSVRTAAEARAVMVYRRRRKTGFDERTGDEKEVIDLYWVYPP